MIRMKALRTFGVPTANEGLVKRGREFAAAGASPAAQEARARDLEAHGLAHRVKPQVIVAALPPGAPQEMAAATGVAAQGPLAFPGGATGAAEPAPSLPPDHPHGRRRSRSSRGS